MQAQVVRGNYGADFLSVLHAPVIKVYYNQGSESGLQALKLKKKNISFNSYDINVSNIKKSKRNSRIYLFYYK